MDLGAQVVRIETRDGVSVITLDSPPVNALSTALRSALVEAIRSADEDPTVGAIVIIGAGRGFSGGADIKEFDKPPLAPSLHDLIDAVEGSATPVVAALHGMTLGGGLELALACHVRIAVPDAWMGLPEVKLGLLPGAGGTQRLPRLVGVETALTMITSGASIGAKAALAIGLVDQIVSGDLTACGIALGRHLADAPDRLVRVRDRNDKVAPLRGRSEMFDAFRTANARKFRGFEATARCIDAVQAAVEMPFDAGLKRERELFKDLLGGAQSAAQRYVFFAERQAARIPAPLDAAETPQIETVGIVGAGTMGGGIAMTFLNAGMPVTIIETEAATLRAGMTRIRKTYERSALAGRLTEADVEMRMARLTGSLELSDLKACDLVIEAVFELMRVKTEVFRKLDSVCKPNAILASNTSYLDVDEIAASTSRPESVIGLHFFSPANVMRLLEIVRGAKTASPVIATCMRLAKTIGKVPVLVGVAHGFVGNRMLTKRQREADALLLEGAMPWDVDRVLYEFGLPMGPFAMADLAGLDLGWEKDKSSSATLREMLCEMDRRGQKSGHGFYDYDAHRRATPSSKVEKMILDVSAKIGVARRVIADEEILERCLYPMINEGAKILDEGIALRASDVDVVWVNGYGWPAYRGGPMYYADTIGLDRVLARMKVYRTTRGEAFAPAPLLERLAADGDGFGDARS